MRAAVLALALSVGCAAEPIPLDEEVGDEKSDELSGTQRGAKLPDPNADGPPAVSWRPPSVSQWPASYVIFNNPGCGKTCTAADQDALRERALMIKMVNAAIRSVKTGGVVRVANFNISSSPALESVREALRYAMKTKRAKVRIVMDSAQDVADSGTNRLAAEGAEVRFAAGVAFTSSTGQEQRGILHSKMVIIDDKVVLTGSNNFSGSGFITNEENSVVLRGETQRDRIRAFICQHDRMFEAGVPPGTAQLGDDDPDRHAALEAIDGCETDDTFFPPAGALTENRSHAFDAVSRAIREAQVSLDIAPNLLAHPALVSAITRRARKAKEDGQPFHVRLVLDGSEDAMSLPAFGECVAEVARRDGLDVEVRYWRGNPEIFQLLHHKFMITDAGEPAAVLWNGSANWSAKAMKWSFENVTRYRAADYAPVVTAFEERFDRIWDQAGPGVGVAACPLDLGTL